MSRWRNAPGVVAAGTLVFALVVNGFAADKKNSAAKPKPSRSPAASPPLIENSGTILGVALFESLEQAREKMERYKLEQEPGASAETEEREAGERMVWRLAETEYLWIVAWANKEGQIVKISASLRPDKKKPFREIGDLARAKAHTDSSALWISRHANETYFRVVARGDAEQAASVYLYSLKPDEFR